MDISLGWMVGPLSFSTVSSNGALTVSSLSDYSGQSVVDFWHDLGAGGSLLAVSTIWPLVTTSYSVCLSCVLFRYLCSDSVD